MLWHKDSLKKPKPQIHPILSHTKDTRASSLQQISYALKLMLCTLLISRGTKKTTLYIISQWLVVYLYTFTKLSSTRKRIQESFA